MQHHAAVDLVEELGRPESHPPEGVRGKFELGENPVFRELRSYFTLRPILLLSIDASEIQIQTRATLPFFKILGGGWVKALTTDRRFL